MTDIVLKQIKSGYNLNKINDNFEKIEEVINNEIIHSTGDNNVMEQELDMNSKHILNSPEPVEPTHLVRLQDLPFSLSDGRIIINTAEEEVVLVDGQLLVEFNELTTTASSFYVSGADVDRGRLITGEDYSVINDKSIMLKESYPEGTIVRLVQNEGSSSDISGNGYQKDTQTLDGVQTAVDFNITLNLSAIYLNGASVDNGRLVEGTDYTVTSTSTIELTSVYPAGTTVTAVSAEDVLNVVIDEFLIYVNSTSGSDSNKGTTAGGAFATIQKAIDLMYEMSSTYQGDYRVVLEAGSYTSARMDKGVAPPTKGLITFEGPDVGGHPNVPTAIITDGATATAEGLLIRNGANVKCKDIKFVGYNGSTASGGFTGGNRCNLFTENVHFNNCFSGMSNNEWGELDMKGGIIENCGYLNGVTEGGYGVRAVFHGKLSVGEQGSGDRSVNPIFRNNYIGVFAQEHINGHVDWCTFEDNVHAIRSSILSRINVDGSEFNRQTGAALWYTDNGVVSLFDTNVFGTGVDANAQVVISDRGSVLPLTLMTTTNDPVASSERTVYRDILNQTVDNTSALVLYTMTLKGNLWRNSSSSVSPMRRIRFKMYGVLNGTNGFKRAQLRFGATPNNITFLASETGDFEVEGFVLLGDNPVGTQLQRITGFNHLGNPRTSSVTSNEDMIADTNFTVEALVENASDSILIESIEVYVDGI